MATLDVTDVTEGEPRSQHAVKAASPWWVQAGRRLLRNPSAVVGLALLLIMIFLAVFAPLIAPYGPNSIDVFNLNALPSGSHWFGTDNLGRDIFTRCLYGGRVSLPAAFAVVLIGFCVGAPIGAVAGFVAGTTDDLLMRIMDLLLCFPGVLLAIGVVSILGPGIKSVVIAVGIITVPGFARVARSSTVSARTKEYVTAARTLGTPTHRILTRHILVNIVDPLIVLATLSLGGAILVTAALSYLGLGSQFPTADWGSMLSQGYEHMFQGWNEVVFPCLAIVVTVLGVNLLGDGVADALNPKLGG